MRAGEGCRVWTLPSSLTAMSASTLSLRKARLFSWRSVMLSLNRFALLATIVVLAWQRNWPVELPGFDSASVPFTHFLPAVRLVELLAAATVAAYTLAGWPNYARLRHGPRKAFALGLFAMWIVSGVSSLWALHPGLSLAQFAHMAVWIAFALMLACGEWPAERLAAAFLGGVLIHGGVGLLQSALQHFVGLGPRFGELPIRPGDGWSSVVFAGSERWLRAYGLSSHPNILGGHVAIGLLLAFGLLKIWPRIWRALIVFAWAIGWGLLLLTFSRSAWAAFALGGVVAGALFVRAGHFRRATLVAALQLAGVGAALAIVFALAFHVFLVGRVQPSRPEDIDSVAERGDMLSLAAEMIAARPMTGVGAANFSVMSRVMLGYPLDWVHNVPLLVTSELGLPGLAAFAAMIASLLGAARRRWRLRSMTMWQCLLGGGLAALMLVMLFDHYVWTTPQGALLWSLITGWWMAE